MTPSVFVHAIEYFYPPHRVSNAFLESLDIGADERWIDEHVGIQLRHSVLSNDYVRETRNADPRAAFEASSHSGAQMGAIALTNAIAAAGLRRDDIGLLIAGGCAAQQVIPSQASLIAAAADVDCTCFDLVASCASFLFQAALAAALPRGLATDFVALVQPEPMTTTVDYRDRSTAVLWGDCATAAIISTRIPSTFRLDNIVVGGDPKGASLISSPIGGHFRQEGRSVQRFAAQRTEQLFKDISRSEKPDAFIGHQANLRMLETVCRRLDIPPDQHFTNVAMRGNCGAASAPSVMSSVMADGFAGRVGVAVVGAGLAWGRCVLEVDV